MFKRLLLLGLLSFTLGTDSLSAKSHSTDSMDTITGIIDTQLEQHEPQDILVCLDVDMTLTVTSEVAAQWPSILKHKSIFKEITKGMSPLEINTLLNLSTKTQPPMLIEKTTPQAISDIMEKGVKVIALTDSMTGSLGEIKSLKDWRINALDHLNIHFDGSFSDHNLITFEDLTQRTGRHPLFFRGVLFTDSGGHKEVNKGSVLIEFLKALDYQPKVVVFLDDRVKYLDIVKKALNSFDPSIQFVGIEYTGGHKFSTGNVSEEEFRTFWEDLAQKAREEANKMKTTAQNLETRSCSS